MSSYRYDPKKDETTKVSGEEIANAAEWLRNLSAQEEVLKDWEQLRDLYLYEGLDVTYMVAVMLKRAGDLSTLSKDVGHLVVLVCQRGTKTGKIMLKTGEDGKKTLADLMAKYNIAETGKGIVLGKATVTLGRIPAAFPLQCMLFYQRAKVQSITNNELARDLPYEMRAPGFCALVPKSEAVLIRAASYYSICFDRVINAKKYLSGPKATKNEISSYITIQLNSSLYTDDERREILTQRATGLFTGTGTSKRYVNSIASAADAWDRIGDDFSG